jgi:hypothetical protein
MSLQIGSSPATQRLPQRPALKGAQISARPPAEPCACLGAGQGSRGGRGKVQSSSLAELAVSAQVGLLEFCVAAAQPGRLRVADQRHRPKVALAPQLLLSVYQAPQHREKRALAAGGRRQGRAAAGLGKPLQGAHGRAGQDRACVLRHNRALLLGVAGGSRVQHLACQTNSGSRVYGCFEKGLPRASALLQLQAAGATALQRTRPPPSQQWRRC